MARFTAYDSGGYGRTFHCLTFDLDLGHAVPSRAGRVVDNSDVGRYVDCFTLALLTSWGHGTTASSWKCSPWRLPPSEFSDSATCRHLSVSVWLRLCLQADDNIHVMLCPMGHQSTRVQPVWLCIGLYGLQALGIPQRKSTNQCAQHHEYSNMQLQLVIINSWPPTDYWLFVADHWYRFLTSIIMQS